MKKKTSHKRAVPVQRIVSTKRPGLVMEIFDDAAAVHAEKKYLHTLHMTPAQRIAHAEELRRLVYGPKYATARLQGPIEILERP